MLLLNTFEIDSFTMAKAAVVEIVDILEDLALPEDTIISRLQLAVRYTSECFMSVREAAAKAGVERSMLRRFV